MKTETKEYADDGVKIGKSLARSQGRIADALEKFAAAAERIATCHETTLELMRQKPLDMGEVTDALEKLSDEKKKGNSKGKGKVAKQGAKDAS